MVIMKSHRDVFPRTDHGYTWVESYWFERDGERISPIILGGGANERLGHMPGGPVTTMEAFDADMEHYKPFKIEPHTETTHEGFFHVGNFTITPIVA